VLKVLFKLSRQYILKVCKVKFYFHFILLDLFWLCSTLVTVVLRMTACVTCLVRDNVADNVGYERLNDDCQA